jgi:hypothetical protein
MAAVERRKGRDFFTYRDNIFNRAMEFCAYMIVPTRKDFVPFDDAMFGGIVHPGAFMAVAHLTGDPLAQGIWTSIYPDVQNWVGGRVTAAVWYDPSIKPELPQDSPRLSLSRAYWGIDGKHVGQWSSGHVFFRTGFDSPDDILFAAQCGDLGEWHGHADTTSFVLHAYGETLVQDPAVLGRGYGSPVGRFSKGPEAHNLVLIDGEGCGLVDSSYGHVNSPPKPGYNGKIDAYAGTETLDFVSMDARGPLVLNPKIDSMKRAERHVVFFRHSKRRGYFVIVDDVIMDSKAHKYEWLLQPDKQHKPVEEGPGQFAFTGNVDLKIRMIEPQDPVYATATYKGYGVDYLRIRSKKDRNRGLFFTILYPKKKDMTLPPITEIRQDGVIGAKIGEDIVLFNTVFDEKGGNLIDAAGVRSDGKLAAIRISGGEVRNAVVLRGSSLTYNGTGIDFANPGPKNRK